MKTEKAKLKFVYLITGKGERKFWTKIGVAFVNRDGSLNVKLDTLPVGGEMHIRDYMAREEGEGPADPDGQGGSFRF